MGFNEMTKEEVLRIENLKMYFKVGKKLYLKAVDDVSFQIFKGETLGVVGESGCGKTTLGRTSVRLYKPTGGKIIFKGDDIAQFNEKRLAPYRKNMHMIFQDPYASLNPRMTVAEIINEPMKANLNLSEQEKRERISELLDLVGLNSEQAQRFPHEFSGGQRQRIGIARSLAANPDFIVCDEPISALDVSIQAQVVNLLQDLQEKLGLTYLFIAHDLSMVKHISDRVGVMYLGRIVELASSDELYQNTLHPYTKALMTAIPIADPKVEENRRRIILSGEVPNPIHPPSGCAFRTRCKEAMPICEQIRPELAEVEPNHFVACHLYDKTEING